MHIEGLEETANASLNILANSSIQLLDGRKKIIIYTFALTHTHTHTHTCTNAHILPHWHKLWMWGGRWLTMLAGRQESLLKENPICEGDTCMHTQVQTNPAIFLAWTHNWSYWFLSRINKSKKQLWEKMTVQTLLPQCFWCFSIFNVMVSWVL